MKSLSFISFLLVAVLSARGGWCQPLSAEEMTGAMESPSARESFDQCVEGKPCPSIVTFKITVSEKGEMRLISSDPVMDPSLMACFEKAVSSIKLRDLGTKYEIQYPLTLSPKNAAATSGPAAPAAETQPAGPAGPQLVAPSGAAASGESSAGASAAPEGNPAGAGTTEVPVDASWEGELRAGKGMLTAGAVLTVMGGALALGTGFFCVIALLDCIFPSDKDLCRTLTDHTGVLVATALSGVAILGLGIGLLVAGIVKKHRAGRMKKQSVTISTFGIGPAPTGDGAAASLTLSF